MNTTNLIPMRFYTSIRRGTRRQSTAGVRVARDEFSFVFFFVVFLCPSPGPVDARSPFERARNVWRISRAKFCSRTCHAVISVALNLDPIFYGRYVVVIPRDKKKKNPRRVAKSPVENPERKECRVDGRRVVSFNIISPSPRDTFIVRRCR